MTTTPMNDQAWGNLADAAEEQRQSAMTARYQELAQLPEDQRQERLAAMAKAEYALPDDRLRVFTKSRIMVWLKMDGEAVQKVASSYGVAVRKLPATMAMRRVAMVQSVAREIPAEDVERLRQIVPDVFADRPTMTSSQTTRPASTVRMQVTKGKQKSWWAFWKKSA